MIPELLVQRIDLSYCPREISKEDFDMDISNMQQELDNLKVGDKI
jgi:wobble nucleotide-excising tRNase